KRRVLDQRAELSLERTGRTVVYDESALQRPKGLFHDADPRGDDGQSARHRLEHGIRRPFVRRRAGEYVDRSVVLRHLLERRPSLGTVAEPMTDGKPRRAQALEGGPNNGMQPLVVLVLRAPLAVAGPADEHHVPG